MVKGGRDIPRKIRPRLNPQDPLCSKGTTRSLDARPNNVKLRHIREKSIGEVSSHMAVFDTGAQQLILGRDGWEIIKRHEKWIDTIGVELGGPSKTVRRLQLVDARGVVKIVWTGSAT